MYHTFEYYGPRIKTAIQYRKQGVLISNAQGTATGFAIWNLQARGKLIIHPQTEVYEGMIVGLHSRDNDLVVNVCKEKQLTNMRAAGKDENIILVPPMKLSLEQALELIAEDELVEVTPNYLRLRKKQLKEHERKKQKRTAEE
jgi:GTP-binding protein